MMKQRSLLGEKCFLVAEVAQAHDGSLGTAHAFIDVVADAGFDAVKFQTHYAEYESTIDEPFRVNFSRQDDSRYSYWKRLEFSPDQWRGLRDHATDCGLVFMSTPFSIEAFEILNDLGTQIWKVASGEFKSWDLLDAMIATGNPILVSTGMSSISEIDEVVRRITASDNDFVLMQCTSKYPTPLAEVGINMLDNFAKRWKCPVGLSDHSGSIWPSVYALSLGASVIEVHVSLSRAAFGPDVSSSLLPTELSLIADARDAFATMKANVIDKDAVALGLSGTRDIFTRSICLRRALKAGHALSFNDLVLKKPGGGIPGEQMHSLIGRELIRDTSAHTLLRWTDLKAEL